MGNLDTSGVGQGECYPREFISFLKTVELKEFLLKKYHTKVNVIVFYINYITSLSTR